MYRREEAAVHKPEGTPSLAELIRLGIETTLFDVHTAFAARVTAVHGIGSEAVSVDVEPGYFRYLPTREPNGDRSWREERYPTIPSVPVLYPHGGGFGMSWPLDVGDWVICVALEHAHRRAIENGEPCDPGLRQRHSLNGLVAVPGFGVRGGWQRVLSDALYLGSGDPTGASVSIRDSDVRLGDDSATAFVALAAKLDAVIDALVDTPPVANDGGAAIQLAVKAAWLAAPTRTCAATKVKAK
jgi:hypothetical protein